MLGAAGSGTSMLGAALAAALGAAHVEADALLFLPSDPPYAALRPVADRTALLEAALPATQPWVLSGCIAGWEGAAAARCTLFVWLRQRERARFGTRVDPGGDMAAEHRAFLAWAARYDDAGEEQRSHALHAAWLARQAAPVLRLDAAAPPAALLAAVRRALPVDAGPPPP